jgi:branched-chain amino acid transport system substrate-binding protein
MKRGAVRCGVFGLAAAALALTACSTNSTSTAGSASPAAASGGSTAVSTAHGKPINLVFLSVYTGPGTSSDGFTGAQAAIRYVNAHGGINGRPLAAQMCVDNADPNLAAACATSAVNNASVIASVGETTLSGAVVEPVFERAGLPIVGGFASVPADFTSPMMFCPTIGGMSGLGATAAATDLLHAKKISFVYSQGPAGASQVALIDSAVLAPRHLPPMNAVGVSPSTGDMSASVAKAAATSPGAIIMFTGQAQTNSFVKAARQQGVTAPILISAGIETPSSVQQQVGDGQNLYFYTYFNHSGPFYNAFLSQWQAAGNALTLADEFAINGWLSVTMFAHVARTLPTVTRASVLAAFNKLTNYSTDGLLPPVSFNKPATVLGGTAPRIVNQTMALVQIQNGAFVPAAGGKFADPFVP